MAVAAIGYPSTPVSCASFESPQLCVKNPELELRNRGQSYQPDGHNTGSDGSFDEVSSDTTSLLNAERSTERTVRGAQRERHAHLRLSECRKRKSRTNSELLRPQKRRSTADSDVVHVKREPSAVDNESHSSPTALNRKRSGRLAHMERSSNTQPNYMFSRARNVGLTTEVDTVLVALSSRFGNRLAGKTYQKHGSAILMIDEDEDQRLLTNRPATFERLNQIVGPYGLRLGQLFQLHIGEYLPVIEPEYFAGLEEGYLLGLDPMVVAAIYSAALPWLLEEESTLPPILNSNTLDEMAFKLFSDSLVRPSTGTLQAGMILMQRQGVDSKSLNSQLVNACFEMALHQDCSLWNISKAELALRKRLAWSLYMQDKWCSLIHGRPSLISNQNWAVPDLSEEDFTQSSSEPQVTSNPNAFGLLFRQLIALTKILAIVLDSFYALQAVQDIGQRGDDGTRVILERAKPVQIKLKEWYSELPSALKLDPSTYANPHRNGFIHLAYFAAEISLHRCIIRSLGSLNNNDYLAHICRSAAKTRLISAMDFVNRLRPEHFKSFWYFPSQTSFSTIGSFGYLLLVTAPSQEEADFYRTRLGEFRWTLGVSNRSALFLTSAVENLDNFETILGDLPEKPSSTGNEEHGLHLRRLSSSGYGGQIMEMDEHVQDRNDPSPGQTDMQASAAPLGLISPSTSVQTTSTYDGFA